MVKIIDSTLALLDKYEPTSTQLGMFCELMKEIGIEDLEISIKACETLGRLPSGFRFYLAPDTRGKGKTYTGIYKYIKLHSEEEGVLSQFQLNDIREIVQLRPYKSCGYVRIIGLDDLICHNYAYVMQEIRELLSESKINFCPEDTFHCATAIAIEWLLGGGKEVTTSLAGIGNRAATEEVLMGLRINIRYKINQNMIALNKLKALLEEITNILLPSTKPIIGEDIFLVESGIHVDGILKKASNYAPYPAEELGRKVHIVIGKHSGSASIATKLKEYNITLTDKNLVSKILCAVKKRSIKMRRGLKDEEFLALAKEVMAYEGEEMDC